MLADDADDDQSLGGDSTAAYDSGDAAQGSFAAELEAVRCRLSAGALQILRGRGCTLEDICDVEHSTLVSARLDEMDVHKLWQVVPELRNRRAAREEAEEYDDRSLGGDSTVAYDSGDETAPYLGEGGARKSSRFWGVNWDKSRKKWKASYRDADGTQRCIGYFVDDEEAARAREKSDPRSSSRLPETPHERGRRVGRAGAEVRRCARPLRSHRSGPDARVNRDDVQVLGRVLGHESARVAGGLQRREQQAAPHRLLRLPGGGRPRS